MLISGISFDNAEELGIEGGMKIVVLLVFGFRCCGIEERVKPGFESLHDNKAGQSTCRHRMKRVEELGRTVLLTPPR